MALIMICILRHLYKSYILKSNLHYFYLNISKKPQMQHVQKCDSSLYLSFFSFPVIIKITTWKKKKPVIPLTFSIASSSSIYSASRCYQCLVQSSHEILCLISIYSSITLVWNMFFAQNKRSTLHASFLSTQDRYFGIFCLVFSNLKPGNLLSLLHFKVKPKPQQGESFIFLSVRPANEDKEKQANRRQAHDVAGACLQHGGICREEM